MRTTSSLPHGRHCCPRSATGRRAPPEVQSRNCRPYGWCNESVSEPHNSTSKHGAHRDAVRRKGRSTDDNRDTGHGQDRGVRRTDGRHAHGRADGADGERRPPHRAVRQDGDDAAVDERGDRAGDRHERALRARVARQHDDIARSWSTTRRTGRTGCRRSTRRRSRGRPGRATSRRWRSSSSLFGNVEDQIVECFQKGGGVPYSAFPKFQQLMAQESAQVFDAHAARRDAAARRRTEGPARRPASTSPTSAAARATRSTSWRRRSRRAASPATTSPRKASPPARRRRRRWDNANATFEEKDVAKLDGSKQFDFITAFDAIHDQAQPRQVLKGIYDALKPGGIFLMADIAGAQHARRQHRATRWRR